MNIKRLEIWLAALDPTVGSEIQKTRPVLVVSNNQNNKLTVEFLLVELVRCCGNTNKGLNQQWLKSIT
jgi:mRNA-degrading endonuclease toxin of MazEF toxin-antitoxin module